MKEKSLIWDEFQQNWVAELLEDTAAKIREQDDPIEALKYTQDTVLQLMDMVIPPGTIYESSKGMSKAGRWESPDA